MKRLFLGVAVLLLLILVGMAYRAWRLPSQQLPPLEVPVGDLDTMAVVQKVAEGLRFPTVSVDGGLADTLAFEHFLAWLETAYPRVHRTLSPRRVHYSLLFRWEGQDTSRAPGVFMAHMDVVPPGDTAAWTHPPFSGMVSDGYIWGRGALDDKGALLVMLEAVEQLLREGHRPRRTLFFAFGHDEEQGGNNGARALARHLEETGIRPAFVVDEGGFVTRALVPGLASSVALVGIAEKGYVTLRVKARGHQGHSSMPPTRSAIGRLAETVARVEQHPMPARLDGATRALFETLAPEMAFPYRMLFANLWLTRPLVLQVLEQAPSSRAMIRTTTVPTIIRGGVKENVVPGQAEALINARILPGDSVETVRVHLEGLIPDSLVSVDVPRPGLPPSPLAPTEDPIYQHLHRVIRGAFPETVVAPYLLLGATDSRHYRALTRRIYRFQPFRVDAELVATIHGVDERVPVRSVVEGLRFYEMLFRSL